MFPWTAQAGANENLAIGNVTWALAFAFCAWDGGRLPTETEWSFAALGGEEQRTHPWGEEPVDDARSAFYNTILKEKKLRPVGSALAGAARWGHLDLNGGWVELVFDAISKTDFYENPCKDCALTKSVPDNNNARRSKDLGSSVSRGGAFLDIPNTAQGVRCARD
jgi:formylglycine-generating enzyme required for sulfatase activity